VVPWNGFELADLLEMAGVQSGAKYVAFETVYRPEEMRGTRFPVLDWPYVEGLRLDEAMHPLTIMATGIHGRDIPPQNGAPLRLVVPWKYGFKSIKSGVRITLTAEEPPTSWNKANAREYGFYSNVNPEVDHPLLDRHARDQLVARHLVGLLDQPVDADGPVLGVQRLRGVVDLLVAAEFVEVVVARRRLLGGHGAARVGEGGVGLHPAGPRGGRFAHGARRARPQRQRAGPQPHAPQDRAAVQEHMLGRGGAFGKRPVRAADQVHLGPP
jgi:hypothetical protein